MKTAGIVVLLLPVCLAPASRAETFTYPELVRRLVDMERLSTLPRPGEKIALASSYDRSSRYDAAHDKYINWGANGDDYGIVRKEGNESVMADIKGPGCIWRMWAAKTLAGHVKFYLDGAATPAIDLPYYGYFDGKHAPFTRPNLDYATWPRANVNGDPYAGGRNNYTPIPFWKSCKIVADPGWGAYYQFTYSIFPAGTVVPTFDPSLSSGDAAALDEADKILSQCGKDPAGTRAGEIAENKTVTIPSGGKVTVADLRGPEAITALKMGFTWPKGLSKDIPNERILARQLTLEITWDDDKAPAVWCPLGDFFGYIGGAQYFKTLPVGMIPIRPSDNWMDDATFYSYWYMPFASHARVVVGNDSPRPVTETWQVTHAPLDRPLAELGRFHAKWHRDEFNPTRPDRWPDWTILTCKGRGRFVGTHLHVWNPNGGWWGEGDDKFFVDGEKFPAIFGTGSEDYFGYAWCLPGFFERPYHCAPRNEGNSQGHVDNNRWHISDAVPFQSSFEGCIEKYFPNTNPTLYAATAFWYLAPGGEDPYGAAPVSERTDYWGPTYREPGAIEGEALQIIPNHLSTAGMQWMGRKWSGEEQLFWWPRGNGEKLETVLPVAKAGKYQFWARFTDTNSSGIFRVTVDGKPAGEPVDLYLPKKLGWMEPGKPLNLGTFDLSAGPHKLVFELAGKNPSNRQQHGWVLDMGLDYVKLAPVSE